MAEGANGPGPYFLMGSALGRGVTNAPVSGQMNALSNACAGTVFKAVIHLWRASFCGERACSRWSAQRSRFYWDRYAPQREQARSPLKRGATKRRSLQGCSECAKLVHEQT